jgi:hypothetical protein
MKAGMYLQVAVNVLLTVSVNEQVVVDALSQASYAVGLTVVWPPLNTTLLREVYCPAEDVVALIIEE